MRNLIFSFMALMCLLIMAPSAPAMQAGFIGFQTPENSDWTDPVIFENLCAPDFTVEPTESSLALNFNQLETVRIELLERGFYPGFHPARYTELDTPLMQAVAQFQFEYDLPVTGQIDASTLIALNVPMTETSSNALPQIAATARQSE